MPRKNRTRQRVPDPSIDVKNKFEETEETLRAIHQGLVDAFLVKHSSGAQVVTLNNADFPYRTMVESMNEGAVTLVPDGTIFYSNPRFSEMVGIEIDRLIGSQIRDLILPEEREEFEALLVNMKEQGTRGEFCLKKSQGGCIPVQLSIYLLDTEPVTGISILVTDMTEHRKAEEALLKSENLLRLIATNSPDVIFAQDRDLRYIWIINPTPRLPADQVIGRTDEDLFPPEEARRLTELKRRVLETGVSVRQESSLSSAGSQRWFDVIYQPLYDQTDQIVGLVCYARDITERIHDEEKIRTLASKLTLAEQAERKRISRILHDDLQQQLFSIKAQLSTLNSMITKDQVPPQILSHLDEAQASLAEAITTTRDLSIDFNPLLRPGEGLAESMTWLAARMLEQHGLHVEIEVKSNWGPLDDHIHTLLFQSVSELLFNVVKHAGTLDATISLEKKNHRRHIIVSDHGKGFDAERIMDDPMASHGLLMIQDRLSLIGCTMKIISKNGQGTRIEIEVPVERKLT